MIDAPFPVLMLPPELTQETVTPFEGETQERLEAASQGVLFDLTQVTFISSAGLSYLVRVGRLLDARQARLVLFGASRSVTKLITKVGLDRFMPLFRTVDEARGYLQKQPGPGPS
jgi:anti-anti-sigma factor